MSRPKSDAAIPVLSQVPPARADVDVVDRESSNHLKYRRGDLKSVAGCAQVNRVVRVYSDQSFICGVAGIATIDITVIRKANRACGSCICADYIRACCREHVRSLIVSKS